MADYSDLTEKIAGSDPLRRKIVVAIAVAADTIRSELPTVPNHTERLAWAKNAMVNLDAEVNRITPLVVAANKSATIAQIEAATDATIQTNVDAVIDFFAV